MRVEDESGIGAGYQLPPGSYEKQLRAECERKCRPDTRLLFEDDFEQLKAAAVIEAEKMFAERLAAGEPIEVASGQISEHRHIEGAPEWIALPMHGGARTVRIYSDDVVEPASILHRHERPGVGLHRGAAATPTRLLKAGRSDRRRATFSPAANRGKRCARRGHVSTGWMRSTFRWLPTARSHGTPARLSKPR